MAEYPEHEKLDTAEAEGVTHFIEWLQDNDYMISKLFDGRLHPGPQPSELIVEHFGIDKQKLEAERTHMLEELRKLDDATRREA